MESFLNPTWFSSKFNRNKLNSLLPNNLITNAGEIIAPVFGGMTSRSEFEILCGTPALNLIGINEFIIMMISCFLDYHFWILFLE